MSNPKGFQPERIKVNIKDKIKQFHLLYQEIMDEIQPDDDQMIQSPPKPKPKNVMYENII